MEKISVRQLTREFKTIVKALPVIITVNGKDRYILKELSDNIEVKFTMSDNQVSDKPVRQVKVSDSKRLSDTKELSDNPIKKTKPKKTPTSNPMEFCSKHPGSRKITCGCR